MTTLPRDPYLEELNRLARYYLRSLSRHPDYEDLVMEAWWRSWQDAARLRSVYPLPSIVKVCCRQAVQSWFQSYRARQMRRDPRRSPAPTVLFLEEILPRENEAGEDDDRQTLAALIAPDPALPLIERLSTESRAALALAAMSALERESCERQVMQGEKALARRLGLNPATVYRRVHSGLARGRAALGEGE